MTTRELILNVERQPIRPSNVLNAGPDGVVLGQLKLVTLSSCLSRKLKESTPLSTACDHWQMYVCVRSYPPVRILIKC
jgi:hypothetical protein